MLSIPKFLKNTLATAPLLSSLGVVGFKDRRGLSPYLFIELHAVPAENSSVQLPPLLATTTVRGRLISDDDSITANWESPLEGTSLDGRLGGLSTKLKSGLIEKYTGISALAGKTLINKTETLQIFKGVESQEKTFMLEFIAYKDAVTEVEAPFNLLKKMASPQLTDGLIDAMAEAKEAELSAMIDKATDVVGEAPFDIAVTVGGRRLKSRWVMQSVSSDRDSIKVNMRGDTIYRQINVTLKSKKAIMRDEISLIKG